MNRIPFGARGSEGAASRSRGGEVLGVAGVAGAAQPALSSILAGVRQPSSGQVLLDGFDVTGAAGYAAKLGLDLPDGFKSPAYKAYSIPALPAA